MLNRHWSVSLVYKDMDDPIVSYIGLGSNLGSKEQNIHEGLKRLDSCAQVDVMRVSELLASDPLGQMDQPCYVNAVAEIRTGLSHEVLLTRLMEIEVDLGRVQGPKWAARTLDMDLLLYGDRVIKTPTLTVPHAQMHLRSFVLIPLRQLAGDLIHPLLKVSIAELERRLQQRSFVLDAQQMQLISITGNIGVGKTTLAQQLVQTLGGTVLYEPYDNNPFMPEVYNGRDAYALDSELHFLVNRANQLDGSALEPARLYVSDYLFDKERVYTRLLLDQRQLRLYDRIYERFSGNITSPRLLIYMEDSSAHCLERIHRRKRPYELDIQTGFLEDLRCGYDKLVGNWQTSPVIRLDVQTFDCLNKEDLDGLAQQVAHYVAINRDDG